MDRLLPLSVQRGEVHKLKSRPRGEVSVCFFICHPDLSTHCLIDEPFTHLFCVLTGSTLHRYIIVLCVCNLFAIALNLLNMITHLHLIFSQWGTELHRFRLTARKLTAIISHCLFFYLLTSIFRNINEYQATKLVGNTGWSVPHASHFFRSGL